MWKKLTRLTLTGIGLATTFTLATAETLTWKIRSFHPNAVELEFYSDNRTRVWPGRNEVYSINGSRVHAITLPCASGEKICYGAWVNGDAYPYWGAGRNGRHNCKDCCYTCNGGTTPLKTLGGFWWDY